MVQCDAQTHEWVVYQQDGVAVKRSPILELEVTALTGIRDVPISELLPIHPATGCIGTGSTIILRLFRYELTRPYKETLFTCSLL